MRAVEYVARGTDLHQPAPVQFAEVAVNVTTGEVRVRRMLGVFAIGRVGESADPA